MPDDVQRLYSCFDGRRRLRDILSQDHETWQRQLELLMLQIGKATIALLPAPVAELKAEAAESGSENRYRFWNEVLSRQDAELPSGESVTI